MVHGYDIKGSVVMIVDDSPINVEILLNALGSEYSVIVAADGESALERLETHKIDIILLDIIMPGMDGFEVCLAMKERGRLEDIPVIFLTAVDDTKNKSHGLKLGAVDYITKPFDIVEVQLKVKNHLLLKKSRDFLAVQNETLENMVRERTYELMLTQDVTIQCLATLVETRDHETGGHIRRTQEHMKIFARTVFKNPDFPKKYPLADADLFYKSAPLHDIGKVGISDSILLKPGRLTPEEYEIMKRHTTIGYEALEKAERHLGGNSFLTVAKEIALTHHEHWDGSGYPGGLKGEEIPLCGRIMAIIDVYDALISKRVYKAPIKHSQALKLIAEEAGRQFDPELTGIFLSIEDQIKRIALQFADYEEERRLLEE